MLIKKNKKLTDELYNQGYITKIERITMNDTSAILPRIHGLPKLHKHNIPLRPVVDTTNSPSYALNKYMNDILKKIVNNEKYNVKNSYEFKKFIDETRVPDDHILVSFDVVSLYTNTDIDEVTNILKRKWPEIKKHTNIDEKLFFELLDFCIEGSTYFKYQDQIYKQKFGLAMGLSLAGTLADILLTQLFDHSIRKLKYSPSFLKKFVDDIISTAPANQVDTTNEIFNMFNGRLKFTNEIEKEKRINFLDMTLIHQTNGRIITNWFTKATSSSRLLNFLSAHPHNMKQNIERSFVSKVFNLSDPIFNESNVIRIRETLQKNNYPLKMIDRIMKDFRFRKTNQKPARTEKPKFASMQYIPKLSETITRTLNTCIPALRVAPKPTKKLKNAFSNMKSKIEKKDLRDVVYGLKCIDEHCEENTYVGHTGRRVGNRTGEHEKDYDNRHKPGGKTAIIRHALKIEKELKMEHKIEFSIDKVLILDREPDKFKREFIESSYIRMIGDKANNFRRDLNNLT